MNYDDFYIVSKSEAEEQVENAEVFIGAIRKYLSTL